MLEARAEPSLDLIILGNELLIERWASGAQHLAYCLRTFPAKAPPEARVSAEGKLAEARKHVGALRVRVNVDVARVFVDGSDVGVSPLLDPVFVDPGVHTVLAKLDGHVGQTLELRIGAGEERDAHLTLAISSRPAGTWPKWPLVAVSGALSVAALAVGIGLTAGWSMELGEANRLATVHGPSGCVGVLTGPCKEQLDHARTSDALGGAAVGLFVGAGILVGATAGLLAVPASRRSPSITFLPGPAGFSIRGTF